MCGGGGGESFTPALVLLCRAATVLVAMATPSDELTGAAVWYLLKGKDHRKRRSGRDQRERWGKTGSVPGKEMVTLVCGWIPLSIPHTVSILHASNLVSPYGAIFYIQFYYTNIMEEI